MVNPENMIHEIKKEKKSQSWFKQRGMHGLFQFVVLKITDYITIYMVAFHWCNHKYLKDEIP